MSSAKLALIGLIGLFTAPLFAEDARTPVFWSTVIGKPGSYYLAQNTDGNGITIAAGNVTLDLNGFRMDGAGQGQYGILIHSPTGEKLSNIEIRNGSITGFRNNGVHDADGAAGVRLIGLRIDGNGSSGGNDGQGAGVFLSGAASLLRDCRITRNAGYGAMLGPYAMVRDNEFANNGLTGLYADSGSLVNGNRFQLNDGNGAALKRLSLVHDNQFLRNTGAGLFAYDGALAKDNVLEDNGGAGAVFQNGNVILENQSVDNKGNGLEQRGASVVIGNQASRNGEYGIDMGGSSVLDRNMASANADNGGFLPDIEPCGSCAVGSNVSARD
jgi:hypothetical protein